MNNNQIIIGTRGRAVQRQIVAWGFITFGASSLCVALMFGFYYPNTLDYDEISSMVMMAFYTPIGVLTIFAGIFGLTVVKTNNLSLDKPVLIYDPYQDVFIGYDCRKNNKEVVIKNGAITNVRGSAFYNSRELIVFYKNEKDQIKKVSLGFCSNISRFAFRSKLNQYHSTKL